MPNRDYRNLLFSAWDTARKFVTSPWLRRHRMILFQVYVLIALVAFAALALLANTIPYFAFDLNITKELQSTLPAGVGFVLEAISWPGYAIQAISIMAVAAVFLAIFGLRWEALSVLFAGMGSGVINYLVKIVVRRPRPTSSLVNVFQTLSSYSFPSGHVMFYTTFFGFLLFLTFVLLKRSGVPHSVFDLPDIYDRADRPLPHVPRGTLGQ